MRRSLLLVLLWVTVTAAGVAIAWTAVGPVARRVVEPAPLGIVPPATGSTVWTAPVTPDPASTPDTAASATPPHGEATEGVRTYTLSGGSVTVSFSPVRVEVVSAVPADGYAVETIEQRGATEVEVEFRSDRGRSRVRAWWDGAPRERVDDDPD